MAFFTGLEGKGRFNGADICVTSWSATETAESFDTTNACDQGNTSSIPGATTLTGTATAFYDSAAPPFANPPNIRAGATGPLNLFLKDDSSPSIDVTTAEITEVTVNSEVKGVVNFSFNFKNNGAYTMPATTF